MNLNIWEDFQICISVPLTKVAEVVGQYFIFVKNEKPVKQHYLKEGASFFIPCILAHFVSFACNVSGYKQESKQDEIPSKLLRTRDQKIFFGNQ